MSPAQTDPRVELVLLAQPRGFCAGVEMAIKALALDGADLPGARLLLPRDRPQQARGRPIPGSGRGVRRRHRRGADREPDHAVGPRLGPRGRGSRPQSGQLRRGLGVPARHQGAPRGEGACRQGLPHRVRRPRGPRGSRRHHGGRAGLDRSGRIGRGGRTAWSRRISRSHCSRRRPCPTATGRASPFA